jgi:hypothetical protein
MRSSIVAILVLTACGLGAEDPAPAEELSADMPNQTALAFYCDAMFNLNPYVYSKVAPRDRQAAVMDAMTAKAQESGVTEWAAFQTKIVSLDPQERQPWVNAGVNAYDMQEACVAVRPGISLSEADRARLNAQRNKLRAAAKEAAKGEGTP